jgi:hypothetical protein
MKTLVNIILSYFRRPVYAYVRVRSDVRRK